MSNKKGIKIKKGIKMKDEYEGVITNYRLGRKKQYPRECIIKVLRADISEIKRLIGWKASWPFRDPKIHGKIAGLHGKSALRAIFKGGVPGQALSTKISITRQKKAFTRLMPHT